MYKRTWVYAGAYLDQFPVSYRGTIGDRFCRAIRAGCRDADEMFDWIVESLDGNDSDVWQQVVETINAREQGAFEFAAHMLWRESLPDDEKQRLKVAGKQSMADVLAPTEPQLAYLKSLGCPDIPATRGEASDLITLFKAAKMPKRIIEPNDLPF